MKLPDIPEKGGDSAQDRNHGTLKIGQPETVRENVTQ